MPSAALLEVHPIYKSPQFARKLSEPENIYSESVIPKIVLKSRAKSAMVRTKQPMIEEPNSTNRNKPQTLPVTSNLIGIKRYKKKSNDGSNGNSRCSVEIKPAKHPQYRRSSCIEEYLKSNAVAPQPPHVEHIGK